MAFVFAVGVLGLILLSPAEAITGAEVIERMQKRFAKAKTFSARFEKRFYWAVLGKELTQSGRIYTRKPGQFRVEVEGDLVVADGQSIWAYTQNNNQVIVSDYNADLLTPWEILVDYTESFVPVSVADAKLDGQSCYTIVLQPQRKAHAGEGEQVRRMKIWVDRKRWHLLQVEQLEVTEDMRTYVLKDHKVNKKFNDDLFVFDVSDGVDVIDHRSAGTN